MKKVMLTAMHSGAGKTVMSCALLAALKNRGLALRAFKCGPDYIDPMFHGRVLGVESRNLDLVLQGREGVLRTLRSACGCDLALLEGAMGYYDGLNGTEQASAYALARVTGTPALLILRPKGSGLSLAAQVRGMRDFRADSALAGLLLADCPDRLAAYLRPLLERETGLPVLGYLPPMEEAALNSRHLGLLTAGEVEDLAARLDALARQAEKTVDLDRLLALAAEEDAAETPGAFPPPRCRIAVARDEAFCFCYADSLDALRRAGAELCFFSPLRDSNLPEAATGLYLCGGYPEMYARALWENREMRRQIQSAVERGMPTVAECGGFLYLQQSLEDVDGARWPMCGLLPGEGYRTGRLQRFGYQWLCPESDSLLFRAGERIPAHEFHYWDSTAGGTDLPVEKADGRSWRCGYASGSLYAAFPHLHLGGELPLAERFVKACENNEHDF